MNRKRERDLLVANNALVERERRAYAVVRSLIEAYARGEENGGIDWEDLDEAHALALKAAGQRFSVDQKIMSDHPHADHCCPNCGKSDGLTVSADATLRVLFDEDGRAFAVQNDDDPYWDNGSVMTCRNCNHTDDTRCFEVEA
ncbi:MAG: hypothetical protein LPL29_13405 [Alphaproteobacteria bacterium]|nr:hypothetical protein [Alphaproteobacteria bacterium]